MKTEIGTVYKNYNYEKCRGIKIDGQFLPLTCDGEYVIVERLNTNAFGYYEGRGSEYAAYLGMRSEITAKMNKNCICGIINIYASFYFKNNRICKYNDKSENIVYKQG